MRLRVHLLRKCNSRWEIKSFGKRLRNKIPAAQSRSLKKIPQVERKIWEEKLSNRFSYTWMEWTVHLNLIRVFQVPHQFLLADEAAVIRRVLWLDDEQRVSARTQLQHSPTAAPHRCSSSLCFSAAQLWTASLRFAAGAFRDAQLLCHPLPQLLDQLSGAFWSCREGVHFSHRREERARRLLGDGRGSGGGLGQGRVVLRRLSSSSSSSSPPAGVGASLPFSLRFLALIRWATAAAAAVTGSAAAVTAGCRGAHGSSLLFGFLFFFVFLRHHCCCLLQLLQLQLQVFFPQRGFL